MTEHKGHVLVKVLRMDEELRGNSPIQAGDLVACKATITSWDDEFIFSPLNGDDYVLFESEVEVQDLDKLGMVIVGYQGIGKTTLSKESHKFIDLESSMMFFQDTGERPVGWEELYVNYAESLANDGHIVFVSSHPQVREELSKRAKKKGLKVGCIAPSKYLEDKWVDRLQERYSISQISKDYRAYMGAKFNYGSDIKSLEASSEELGIPLIHINNLNYNLQDKVCRLLVEAYSTI